LSSSNYFIPAYYTESKPFVAFTTLALLVTWHTQHGTDLTYGESLGQDYV